MLERRGFWFDLRLLRVCQRIPEPWVNLRQLLCQHEPLTSTSWKAILICPFWDYGAAWMLLCFVFLYSLRKKVRKWSQTWQKLVGKEEGSTSSIGDGDRRNSDPHQSRRKLDGRGNRVASLPEEEARGDRHRVADVEEDSRSDHQALFIQRLCICVCGCIRTVLSCLCESSKAVLVWIAGVSHNGLRFSAVKAYRTLLQTVLQWWVVGIAMLVLAWYWTLGEVIERYHIPHHLSLTHQLPKEVPAPLQDHMPLWLFNFSVYSFVALAIIYLFSSIAILLQVIFHAGESVWTCKVCQPGSGLISLPRDVAIQVLLLPMVYGLMGARSVVCMYNLISGELPEVLFCHDQDGSAQLSNLTADATLRHFAADTLDEVYESNFALADAYEAWALYQYAHMVVKVIQEDLKKSHQDFPQTVLDSFEFLLLINLRGFVVVCVAASVFSISLTWCRYRRGFDLTKTWNWLSTFSSYEAGANWCVSCIAILAILAIERKFEDKFSDFGPSLKFWSIKIMIGVSFWMQPIMAIARDVNPFGITITEKESKLLDASVRIYVMAIVSVLNFKAWWPWSNWYKVVITAEETKKRKPDKLHVNRAGLNEPLLPVPQSTVDLVQELLPNRDLSSEEARDWSKVKQIIEEQDDKELLLIMQRGTEFGRRLFSEYDYEPPSDEISKTEQSSGWFGRMTASKENDAPKSAKRSLWDGRLSHEDRQHYLIERLHALYPRPPKKNSGDSKDIMTPVRGSRLVVPRGPTTAKLSPSASTSSISNT